ncbi:MAG: DNA translocase FtsK [Chloroflexota bacterium]
MADPKSTSTTSKTSKPGAPKLDKPAGTLRSATPPPAPPKPTRTPTKKADAPKLVKVEKPAPAAPRKAAPAQPEFHPMLDPDRFGKLLHERPAWIDELGAIALVVFGFVSLFALLNTTSTSLAAAWAENLRQFFGSIGAMLVCGMIITAGVLIALPRIGVHLPISWGKIITIEVAYFAFLGVLHLSARDPEPRALARTGQGGGYIGWAISEPLFKLFGSSFAMTIFAIIIVVCLSNVFGINRKHLRQVLTFANKQFETLAERMKRPPRPRQVSPFANAANQANAALALDTTAEAPTRTADPMVRPLRQTPAAPATPEMSRPASALATQPDLPSAQPAASTLATPSPTPAKIASKPRTASKPAPPIVPERPKRYFTVEDFKEVRQNFPRSGDLPSTTLLNDMELNKPTEQEINNNVRIIENTLLEFDIDVEVVDVKVGPTVTQYAVQPFREVTNDQGEVVMQRVRVNKIASLTNDLALALSAKRLRIQPYVPGHPYMGIEVPNRKPSTVALRPVMESETFARAFAKRDPDMPNQTREVPLTVPLGRDVSGAAFVVDLATMPHLLIAGTTGSGKSVGITAMIMSLVMNNTPERMQLVMLDPKMVELSRFNGLPHLLGPVETDMERIIGVLRWATREMDRRYKLLEGEATRNIESYNRALGKRRQSEHLPYIVIFIDEIGDLMLSRPDEMERTLTRLAQMARAVGMHLVVATQRPSVDIITGLIKANFPARISFAVASGVDSRVILDTTGAETLMGRGDMLYLAPDAAGPQRLQGCFVSDSEIDAVMNFWKDWQNRQRQESPADQAEVAPWERGLTRRESLNDTDPMLEDAIDLVVREGEASASLIQRRLGIGYPRAAQLLDMLAELGVVGSLKDGGRSREVLLKPGMDKYKKLLDKRRK